MPEKIYGLLGLAQRAGKIASGEAAAEANLQKNKAKLVILAEDAADRTKEQFSGLCSKNKVNLIIVGDKLRLGIAIGKSPRAVVVVLDENFAQSLVKAKEASNISNPVRN